MTKIPVPKIDYWNTGFSITYHSKIAVNVACWCGVGDGLNFNFLRNMRSYDRVGFDICHHCWLIYEFPCVCDNDPSWRGYD